MHTKTNVYRITSASFPDAPAVLVPRITVAGDTALPIAFPEPFSKTDGEVVQGGAIDKNCNEGSCSGRYPSGYRT